MKTISAATATPTIETTNRVRQATPRRRNPAIPMPGVRRLGLEETRFRMLKDSSHAPAAHTPEAMKTGDQPELAAADSTSSGTVALVPCMVELSSASACARRCGT